MSRDIRSFLISPKSGESKKNDSEEKKSKTKEKGRSKKRAIISSDEDEPEIVNQFKNTKKAKLSEKQKNSEKLVEVTKPESIFSKKPVKRVNAITVTKKSSKESPKKASPKKSNLKIEIEDDEFEATLDQLDTSQIEEKYLNHVKNSTIKIKNESPSKNEKHSSKNGTKDSDIKPKSSLNFKKVLEKYENTSAKPKSPSKEKNSPEKTKKSSKKETSTSSLEESPIKKNNTKDSENKSKKKNNSSKLQIEMEKNEKSQKNSKKEKINDYNEIIEEKIEKKKQNAKLYQSYLNRGGARNPGSKEIPQRNDQCFANMTFLITGVLDSLERDEADEIIKSHGGKIISSVTKKLNYLIVGDQPGPSKLAKAESLSIQTISEDDFLDLLRTLPQGPEGEMSNDDAKRKRKNSNQDEVHGKTKKKKNDEAAAEVKIEKDKKSEEIIIRSPEKSKSTEQLKNEPMKVLSITDTALVEKYRPKNMKQIIGQTGDKSNAKKLHSWLNNWHKNHNKDVKVTKPKWPARDDTGAIFKAALLSGPPGIGKTTTAYVVCAELGFEVLEFNASDTRSKRLLKDEIASILSNKTVASFMKHSDETKKQNSKHVLLMDEVDGMAGNEDRGGMQELISFIKNTEIPIICICNDRQSQKIKSLANYTFDLRFQKPRLEQIKAAMMSICFKEGIKISQDELTKIIQSTNQDIRQVINHLAMASVKSVLDSESKIDKFKNLKLGPWDVIRKVFSKDENASMNIHEKSDLFFHDYNISSLFVEENYLIVTPSGPKNEILDKISKCSESLAIGDTIENSIRGRSAWSLLPVQAIFSSVIPGTVMSGFINSQINFPSWLGKNSRRSKFDRLLQDLTVHSRITTGASKEAINLDYIKPLLQSIIKPLEDEGVEGVDEAIEVMKTYHLTREDLDSLIELVKWPHTKDPMEDVSTKTKTALTKAYNKHASFIVGGSSKKKATQNTQDEDFIDDEGEISDDEEDDVVNDKLIKAKVSKAKNLPAENKGKSKAKKQTKSQSKKK